MTYPVSVDVRPEVVCATWLNAWQMQDWTTMATLSRTREQMSERDCIRNLQNTLRPYKLLMPQYVHLEPTNESQTAIQYKLKRALVNKVIVNFYVSLVRERGMWLVDPATVKASK